MEVVNERFRTTPASLKIHANPGTRCEILPRIYETLWAKQFCDPLLHLPGRLVGEGEGQDTEGVHPLGQQVGDADGEHPGLARPGAGDHQVGPRGVQDGLALGLVQSFEMLHGQATKVAVPARAPGACG